MSDRLQRYAVLVTALALTVLARLGVAALARDVQRHVHVRRRGHRRLGVRPGRPVGLVAPPRQRHRQADVPGRHGLDLQRHRRLAVRHRLHAGPRRRQPVGGRGHPPAAGLPDRPARPADAADRHPRRSGHGRDQPAGAPLLGSGPGPATRPPGRPSTLAWSTTTARSSAAPTSSRWCSALPAGLDGGRAAAPRRRATPAARYILTPVYATGAAVIVAIGVLATISVNTSTTTWVFYVFSAVFLTVPLGFVAGILRMRLFLRGHRRLAGRRAGAKPRPGQHPGGAPHRAQRPVAGHRVPAVRRRLGGR